MKYKIEHDRPVCIGCGACAALTPEHWIMVEDGLSDLKGAKVEGTSQIKEVNDLDGNLEAAEACPVNCIHIHENGKRLI